MPNTLFATTKEFANPLYDGRATAGIRSRKTFEEGTRFVYSYGPARKRVVGLMILWGATVHHVSHSSTSDETKFAKLREAFKMHAVEIAPNSFDEAMMMIDPYFSGMGYSASVAELVLDGLIRAGTWETEELLQMLEKAHVEASN